MKPCSLQDEQALTRLPKTVPPRLGPVTLMPSTCALPMSAGSSVCGLQGLAEVASLGPQATGPHCPRPSLHDLLRLPRWTRQALCDSSGPSRCIRGRLGQGGASPSPTHPRARNLGTFPLRPERRAQEMGGPGRLWAEWPARPAPIPCPRLAPQLSQTTNRLPSSALHPVTPRKDRQGDSHCL